MLPHPAAIEAETDRRIEAVLGVVARERLAAMADARPLRAHPKPRVLVLPTAALRRCMWVGPAGPKVPTVGRSAGTSAA